MSRLDNVLQVLAKASQTDVNEGKLAYLRYRKVCLHLSQYYGYPLEKVVSVFAALSPNNDYKGNLKSAVSVLIAHSEGIPVEQVKISTYNHCRDRAYSYLEGVSFPETVKGAKILNFYYNILCPLSPFYVTVDGHAYNIIRNEVVSLKSIPRSSFKYDEIAETYFHAAKIANILPNQLQAITWFTWKRINNIIYVPPQLSFFRDNEADLWNTYHSPEDIKPYEFK